MSEAVKMAANSREVCGLLLDNGYFLQLKRTRNISRRPGSFCLDNRQIRSICKAARKVDLEIVGTFHSHIVSPAEPGKSDIDGAQDDSMMLVLDTWDRKIGLWSIHNHRAYSLKFDLI